MGEKSSRYFCVVLLLLWSIAAFSQSLLPLPSSVVWGDGYFVVGERLERSVTQVLSRSDSEVDGSYRLRVDGDGIVVTSGSDAGFFYAFQTLRQLLEGDSIRYVELEDTPRFPYRGMMLDCSRHFWDIAFIKRQMDVMERFKLNRLHLHLTDAAGWRMEIAGYPLLTARTAWRTQSDWTRWWTEKDRRYCDRDVAGAYGGFYTQDELRELVRYGSERHITIIPEIEMPGHCEEVLFAYPELRCEGAGADCGDLCVGNEKTFEFLEGVLLEVMRVFPSKYIHIGGDESGRQSWLKCGKCRARMASEGLDTPARLQAYLTSRIGRFLNEHGRELLGWDEILEGELTPGATVMSWRGTEGGLAAARMGHEVVMSPGGYCYLDGYQDAPEHEPKAFGGYLPLEKVYGYDPVPDELKGTDAERRIIGIQGNLWTEMIERPEHVEYMLYPRMLAIAERGWSERTDNYANFRQRALKAIEWLKAEGYHPFDLEGEKGKRQESRTSIMHKGLGKRVTYKEPYADAYRAGGDGALTDGLRGDWSYGDGRWQGFIGSGRLDVVIDMGAPTDIRTVSADFMQFCGPEIFFPASIVLCMSDDGTTWSELCRESTEVSREKDYFIRPFAWRGEAFARYVRLQAKAGTFGGWVFTDEIVIN